MQSFSKAIPLAPSYSFYSFVIMTTMYFEHDFFIKLLKPPPQVINVVDDGIPHFVKRTT